MPVRHNRLNAPEANGSNTLAGSVVPFYGLATYIAEAPGIRCPPIFRDYQPRPLTAGFHVGTTAGFSGFSKDIMSHKLDFITYAKSTLVTASSKLQSAQPPDLDTARRLDQIVRTAEDISTGYWAKIEPLYQPFAPKLQLAVRHLNADIVAGQSILDFDAYIGALASNLAT